MSIQQKEFLQNNSYLDGRKDNLEYKSVQMHAKKPYYYQTGINEYRLLMLFNIDILKYFERINVIYEKK